MASPTGFLHTENEGSALTGATGLGGLQDLRHIQLGIRCQVGQDEVADLF